MTFTRMDQSTESDWQLIAHESVDDWALVPDRVLGLLRSLAKITNGFSIDQLQHCLQTATRAERAGANGEIVVGALCHDIGKAISEPNHPAVGAAILAPFVSDDVEWMVRVHKDFQGRHFYQYLSKDPSARDLHRAHPAYELARQFADEWDQTSFDPCYDTFPLEHFESLVRRTFKTPRSNTHRLEVH